MFIDHHPPLAFTYFKDKPIQADIASEYHGFMSMLAETIDYAAQDIKASLSIAKENKRYLLIR